MKVRALGAAAAVLLMFTAVGCGSKEDTARKSLAADLHSKSNDKFSLTQKDADCVAKKMVDKPGVKKLQDAGILDKNYKVKNTVDKVKMSKDDADSTADAIVNCTDAKKLFFDAMEKEGTSIPAQAKSCLESKISESDIHDVFSAVFQGNDEGAGQGLASKMMACASSMGGSGGSQ